MKTSRVVPVVRKAPLKQGQSDLAYWQTQSYEARLAALEEIRREYHLWKYVLSQDFKEFVGSLNDNGVEYLIIGGYAVAFH